MNYPYATEQYLGRLEFKDAFGLEAQFHCHQRFRASYTDLACVSEQVWGDGDQWREFEAVGSKLVRLNSTPSGRSLAISLLDRPTKRGAQFERSTVRSIHHAFKDERQWWEYAALSPTTWARLAIRFPIGREPRGISVATAGSTPAPFVSRPATNEIVLNIKSPVVGAVYRIDWSW